MSRVIIFRSDAAPQIGIGHVKRCLALAQWAQRAGFECHMVSRFTTAGLRDELARQNVALHMLPAAQGYFDSGKDGSVDYARWLGVPWERDAEETLAIFSQAKLNGTLIVDHYGIDARWERRLRPVATSIVVIDDLANREHDCDVLIDQTLGRIPDAYRGLVSPSCALLLGTDYALLRPEFSELRPRAIERRRNTTSISQIFVSLGGTDAGNLTEPCLRALAAEFAGKNMMVDVVLSRDAPHFERVARAAAELPLPIQLHADAPNVAQLMVDADVAIGAAGTTAWERACLGLPTVMVVTAENQRGIAQALASSEAVILVEDAFAQPSLLAADLVRGVETYVADPARWRHAIAAALNICDGCGAARVLRTIAPA